MLILIRNNLKLYENFYKFAYIKTIKAVFITIENNKYTIPKYDRPKINPPNTTPIPTPAPIKPVVGNPVPIIFAACIIIYSLYFI